MITKPSEAAKTVLGLRKRSLMYLSFAAGWGLTVLWFNPRLFSLYAYAHTPYSKIILTLFILTLDIFWVFGTYYLMLFLFTLLSKKRPLPKPLSVADEPKVAILYLTLNDFQHEAALTCIRQDYSNFHVFLLDDSTDQSYRDQVTQFAEQFPTQVTVIRRATRQGFKAGSINYALRNFIKDYPYFAVIDSDGILPKDFLRKMVPHFGLDPSIAFVQGSHAPNPIQKSQFADDLAIGILPLWNVYYGPRNEYGFVIFLGHGGVIRRDVWEKVGGFPEIVSEDLGFSTKVRELGFQGYFVPDVVSYEDFPETYEQLRKQQEKYIKGGCEYIHKHILSFLRSSNVHWFEKLDVVLSCSSLFLPPIHIFFILLFSFLLPHAFGEKTPLSLEFGNSQIQLWNAYVLKENFHQIWTADFYIITLINMFAPILGCLRLIIAYPAKVIRLILLSTVPYLSIMVVCSVGILTYLATRKAAFLVTGNKAKDETLYNIQRNINKISWAEKLNSTHWVVQIVEVIAGIIFSIICIKTLTLSLLGFSISMVLGVVLLRYGWDHKVVKPLMYMPFALITSAMGFLGLNFLGVQGIFFIFFSIHF